MTFSGGSFKEFSTPQMKFFEACFYPLEKSCLMRENTFVTGTWTSKGAKCTCRSDLRTCPELSPAVADSFQLSRFHTHFGAFSSSDDKTSAPAAKCSAIAAKCLAFAAQLFVLYFFAFCFLILISREIY